MRILVFFNHGDKPGLLKMLHGLEEKLKLKGHDFFYVVGPKESYAFDKYGFDLNRIEIVTGLKKRSNPLSSFVTLKKIRDKCVTEKIDVILTYTLSTLPMAMKASDKTGIPIVAWLHNAYPDADYRYNKFGLYKCKNIITVSDFIMEEVRSYLRKKGIVPEKRNLNIVYNAFDIEGFIKKADLIDDSGNIEKEEGDFLVAMIAAMDRNKNPQLLLKVAKRVIEVNSRAKFWFVGGFPDEQYEEETGALVKELGIAKNVCFWGPRLDISRICRQLDLFVQPSFRDACPLAPIEAMIWSTPVVASRTGGIPEIVAHEETGLLCEPGNEHEFADAIIRIMTDPQLAQKMGAKGRERVEKMFTMDRLSRDVEEIFSKIKEKSHYN